MKKKKEWGREHELFNDLGTGHKREHHDHEGFYTMTPDALDP